MDGSELLKRSQDVGHADSSADHQSLHCSILIISPYDASGTAYKLPQFRTHSSAR
jgi:hypothetical protein